MDHMNDISNTLIEEDISNNTIIKHIVISGGGHYGLTMYGILKESHKQEFWKYENIETLYGTSIGSVLCLLITLQYDWETLDKYFIDRPWDKVFNFDFHTIIEAFENQGIFNQTTINRLLEPLFLGKDIPLDITLKEYYERTRIDLYITTSEVVSFKLNVLSHKTHPEWKLLDAIYASCTIPIVFKPIITDDSCYIDGGLFSSYPLDICTSIVSNTDEIMAIRKSSGFNREPIQKNANLFDIIKNILRNAMKNFNNIPYNTIKNEIQIYGGPISFEGIIRFSTSREERINTIEEGVTLFKNFVNSCD
jgi:NTE family protein